MFESKPLSEIDYNDLSEFLREGREEGVRLDYKQEWGSDIAKDVCGMANTQGGTILVGIKERRREGRGGAKLAVPNPDDVPGIPRGNKDWKARTRDQVISRTRPPVVPEVKVLETPDDPERVVVAIRVDESPDAPHEYNEGNSPQIPIRRADSTQSTGLDDVERLIYRRDRARDGASRQIDLRFFEDRIALSGDSKPPIIAAFMRPRRVISVGFTFSHHLDEELRDLALRHELGSLLYPRPIPGGVSFEQTDADNVRMCAEICQDGTILWAHALRRERSAHVRDTGPSTETVEVRRLDFWELSMSLLGAVGFAAGAYALERPGLELEIFFGLHDAQGHEISFPATSGPPPFHGYSGRLPDSSPLYRPPSITSAYAETDPATAKVPENDRIRLIRELSRLFGVSVPDGRLREYI